MWFSIIPLSTLHTSRYTEPRRRVGFIGPEHGDLWRYGLVGVGDHPRGIVLGRGDCRVPQGGGDRRQGWRDPSNQREGGGGQARPQASHLLWLTHSVMPKPPHVLHTYFRYDGCDRWVSSTFVPAFANQEYGREFRCGDVWGWNWT